jgi:hypothetical protein
MNKLYFILFLFLTTSVSQRLTACNCQTLNNNWITSYKTSSAIIIGSVLSLDTITYSSSFAFSLFDRIEYVKVRISIHSVIKGKITQDTITIHTPSESSQCGYPFALGSEYVIYLNPLSRYKNNLLSPPCNSYTTNKCLRTTNEIFRDLKLAMTELKMLSPPRRLLYIKAYRKVKQLLSGTTIEFGDCDKL